MPVEKYKIMKCTVLNYNPNTKELDIDFLGYGIRLYNVSANIGDNVNVKYRGKIGTPNFVYKL